ncbi:MAG: ABC transporter substrate-binding protein [Oscillospiraceae bacterium]|nr:ABC transporter substrate-binding protein [Oscillospiraceae bacterium]
MKKKVLATILVLTLALTLLAGCGKTSTTAASSATAAPAAEEAQEPSNELFIGVAQDFDSLDPHHATAAGTKEVLFNVFEGLMKPTSEGELVPAVASDVSVSDDGLTYTFTLRQGVKFHNGDTVDMQDVVFSIERNRVAADGGAALIPALAVIEDLSYDDTTLTLQLSEPSLELLSYLTLAIIPADYDEQETAPVGTGPFKFVSRAAQDNMVLERFEDYWGTPAKLDKVTFRIIENVEGLIMGLQSGALDLVMHMTSTQTSQLSEKDFHVEVGSMNLVQALYLNNAVAPFDDVRVRQALCYGVDKQGIIDLAFDGYGIPLGTSMFPSFGKYYDESLTDYYPHDVEKAKALLAEAGYPNGFDMTISVPSNYQPHVDTAEVIKEQLKEIGVNVTILPVEWGVWLSDVYGAREYQSTITGLTSDNMTARKLLERFGSQIGNNFTNYSNSEYDEILAKAVSSTSDEEQTALYRQLEHNLTENAANVYIQDMADLVAVRNGVEGLTFYPLYVLDVSTLYWAA